MVSDPGEDEPLLRAIGELRAEVDRLIDAEVRRREVVAHTRELVSRLVQQPVAPREEPPFGVPASPSTPIPTPPTTPMATSISLSTKALGGDEDPGKRLDLLAQKLANRLRQATPATGRPAAGDRTEVAGGREGGSRVGT